MVKVLVRCTPFLAFRLGVPCFLYSSLEGADDRGQIAWQSGTDCIQIHPHLSGAEGTWLPLICISAGIAEDIYLLTDVIYAQAVDS